jgi:tetratricopeptide (TPR) repeat protein
MRVMAARQNAGEAENYGRQVREANAESMATARARTLSNFALGAARDEDWPKAIEQLREALTVCGNCPVSALLRKNLGLIRAQSGDSAGALADLDAAHRLDPGDLDIEYALGLLRKRGQAGTSHGK